MLFRRAALLALLSVPFAACFAQETAAHKAQASKDEAELQAYTLTMDNVTHMFQATAAINQLGKTDPTFKDALKRSGDDEGQQTIEQMSAKLSSFPKIVGILSSYNLTPRKYSLTLMSLFITGFAVAAIDMGAKEQDEITQAHVNPANIAFARAHKAELEELGKEYPMNSGSSSSD